MKFVGIENPESRRRKERALHRARNRNKKVVRMKNGKIDPLKTFNMKGRGKK